MSRTYIITGAGSGIGKKTAEILRERGNKVVGVDLKNSDVEGDLSTTEGRIAAADAALEAAGGSVDAVIACAGLALPKAITAKVNYFGVTEFLERLQPALAKSAAPRVAVISSMASLQPVAQPLVDALMEDDEQKAVAVAEALEGDPQTENLIYSSSKRALAMWVRRESVTEKWAGAGIPVNAVGPGTVVTPMTADLLSTPEGSALVDAVVPMPLNSHQPAESISHMLIWLTSEENTHTTGQTIYNDGGADAVLRGSDVWTWNEPAIVEKFQEIYAKLQG